LSNLDALLRMEMRAELKAVLREAGTTTLYVTHDQTEAMGLADRIAVMHDGRIEQLAPPMAVYRTPATVFVGSFVGAPPMNFLPGVVRVNGSGTRVAVGESQIAPSPALEPLLAKFCAQQKTVTMRWSTEFLSLEQDAEGVNVKVRSGGSDSNIRARYVVGCDGGVSPVRHAIAAP
jgi:ABC-type sugar transport system ATPase subunit